MVSLYLKYLLVWWLLLFLVVSLGGLAGWVWVGPVFTLFITPALLALAHQQGQEQGGGAV